MRRPKSLPDHSGSGWTTNAAFCACYDCGHAWRVADRGGRMSPKREAKVDRMQRGLRALAMVYLGIVLALLFTVLVDAVGP